MNKASFAGLVASGCLILMGASECPAGKPAPDNSPDTVAECLVYGQGTNSKGQHYLEVKCSLPGGGLEESAELLPGNNPDAWPACGNGANWPACKEG